MISLLAIWIITKIHVDEDMSKYFLPLFIFHYLACIFIDCCLIVRLCR